MNLSKINPKIIEIIDANYDDIEIIKFNVLEQLFAIDLGLDVINYHLLDQDSLMAFTQIGLVRKNYDTGQYELVYPLYATIEEESSIITDEYIEEYRNKFTSYGKSIKIGIKGDKAICKKKLEKWLKNNKAIKSSLDEILQVTEFYVNGMLAAGKGKFIMQADNFIYKDGQSMLSNMLEEYRNTSKESDIFDNQMI